MIVYLCVCVCVCCVHIDYGFLLFYYLVITVPKQNANISNLVFILYNIEIVVLILAFSVL